MTPFFSKYDSLTIRKYKIEFKAKNSNQLSRRQVFDTVTKCVPFYHIVSMDDPQVMIFVYALKNTCLLGVAEDYVNLLEFNINAVKSRLGETATDSASGANPASAKQDSKSAKVDQTTSTAESDKSSDGAVKGSEPTAVDNDGFDVQQKQEEKEQEDGLSRKQPRQETTGEDDPHTKRKKQKKQKKAVIGGIKLF